MSAEEGAVVVEAQCLLRVDDVAVPRDRGRVWPASLRRALMAVSSTTSILDAVCPVVSHSRIAITDTRRRIDACWRTTHGRDRHPTLLLICAEYQY